MIRIIVEICDTAAHKISAARDPIAWVEIRQGTIWVPAGFPRVHVGAMMES